MRLPNPDVDAVATDMVGPIGQPRPGKQQARMSLKREPVPVGWTQWTPSDVELRAFLDCSKRGNFAWGTVPCAITACPCLQYPHRTVACSHQAIELLGLSRRRSQTVSLDSFYSHCKFHHLLNNIPSRSLEHEIGARALRWWKVSQQQQQELAPAHAAVPQCGKGQSIRT